MPIRDVTNHDMDFVNSLDESVFSAESGRGIGSSATAMAEPGATTLIYTDDTEGSQLGFAIVQWDEKKGQSYLAKLAVIPEMRHKGIGKALLMQCEKRMRDTHGSHEMYLHVSERNHFAQHFFTISGFKSRSENPKRYFLGWVEALLMVKIIE
jgi:ribosomal protein S18 acetylase RimI-like enzyme